MPLPTAPVRDLLATGPLTHVFGIGEWEEGS